MARELKGRYVDITIEELKEYANLDLMYMQILKDIYNENKGLIPQDMIAYLADITSYDSYAKNYIKAYDGVISGDVKRIFDYENINIKKFSESMKDQFIRWNCVPYKVTETEIWYAVINEEYKDLKSPLFIQFITTCQEAMNRNYINKQPRLKKVTNKLFADILYTCLDEPLYEQEDMILIPKHRLNLIFTSAIIKGASDIYITPYWDHADVKFSILGDAVPYCTIKKPNAELTGILQEIFKIAGKDYDDAALKDDPRRDFKILELGGHKGYYARVQATVTKEMVNPVLRVAKTQQAAVPFEKLKITEEHKSKLAKGLRYSSGLVLICGATGSGKSTTIYSCIDYLKKIRPTDVIEEFSKPVEAVIDGISQIDIDEDSSITLDKMVEAATRRNAQIIVVGEVNTENILTNVLNMSMQGKYVISTIHSDSVSRVFDRVKNMLGTNVDAYYQFIDLINVIMHQTMMKEACPHCKKEIEVETLPDEQKDVLAAFSYDKSTIFVNGEDKACPHCEGRGYLINKPVIISSILVVTEEMRNELSEMTRGMRLYLDNYIYDKNIHEIYDAMRYLKDGKILWDQAWDKLNMEKLSEAIKIKHRGVVKS